MAATRSGNESIMKPHKCEKGFTLIELLTVIIIVAILAAVSAPIYMNYIKNARATDAQTAISAIYTAEKVYSQKHDGEWVDVSILENPDNPELTLDPATKQNWQFEVQISEKKIIATSTENMPGGAGKEVRFDAQNGKFEGYGITE